MLQLAHTLTLTGANGRIWGEVPMGGQSGLVTVIQTPPSAAVRGPAISVAAFDGKAELLATVTSKGDTYVFNIPQNRYARVDRTGHAGTAAAFSSVSMRQLFVGFAVRMHACTPLTLCKTCCHVHTLTHTRFMPCCVWLAARAPSPAHTASVPHPPHTLLC